MQVTETKSEGLSREFKVVIPAATIAEQMDKRLRELASSVNVPGFRPGKAPVPILRQRYGQSVMGEVIERTLSDSSRDVIDERGFRIAIEPKIEITEFKEGANLEFTMAIDLFPEIGELDYAALKAERIVPDLDEATVDEALERLRAGSRRFVKVENGRAAESGDAVLIDFVGRIDGTPFEGGTVEAAELELGSGRFIPGFEDQLIGVKAGESRDVTVAFPENFGAKQLAGKTAMFAVTVKELRGRGETELNDEFAKTLGLEDLAGLRKVVREQLEGQAKIAARAKTKRELLDEMNKLPAFPLPGRMVEMEFNAIWDQIERARKRTDPAGEEADAKDAKKDDATEDDEALKAEYRTIAKRRVQLGLLLSEIGRRNNITVNEEEAGRALAAEARRHSGHEREVMEFYRRNPQAMSRLTAPLFEDKVIDFILEMAKAGERKVPAKELLEAPSHDHHDHGHDHGHDHDHDHDHGDEASGAAKKTGRKTASKKD